jgi:hypothetical protein
MLQTPDSHGHIREHHVPHVPEHIHHLHTHLGHHARLLGVGSPQCRRTPNCWGYARHLQQGCTSPRHADSLAALHSRRGSSRAWRRPKQRICHWPSTRIITNRHSTTEPPASPVQAKPSPPLPQTRTSRCWRTSSARRRNSKANRGGRHTLGWRPTPGTKGPPAVACTPPPDQPTSRPDSDGPSPYRRKSRAKTEGKRGGKTQTRTLTPTQQIGYLMTNAGPVYRWSSALIPNCPCDNRRSVLPAVCGRQIE